VKPITGRSGEFLTDTEGRTRDIRLVPFYRLHRRAYATYWDLFTLPEYESAAAALAAERERLRKLEAATIANVPVGDEQGEKEFNFRGDGARVLRADAWRPGRRASKWFAYDVPVPPAQPVELVVTYNTDTWVPRSSEILVEGRRIGEQTLEPTSVSRFFDVEYPVPEDLLRGKQKVTVRFAATRGNETASVFGIRIVRAEKPGL
jgi:hypothetical protein